VVVAYTRCASLAAKAQGGAGGTVEPSRFVAEAERELHSAVRSVGERVRTARQADDLEMALREAAALRPAVDRYFDEVLVMDPDPTVRANRLAQLEEVRALLGAFGEFSRLSVQGS
jgi:glycyl-tRNA synthetase beta chain